MSRRLIIFYLGLTFINLIIFSRTVFHKNFCTIKEQKCYSSFIQNDLEEAGIRDQLKFDVIDLEKQRAMYINEIQSLKQESYNLQNLVYNDKIKLYRIRNSVISLQQIKNEFQRRQKRNFIYKPILTKFKEQISSFNETKMLNNYECTVFRCFNLKHCGRNQQRLFTYSIGSSLSNSKHSIYFNKSIFYDSNSKCSVYEIGNSTFKINDINLILFEPELNKLTKSIIVHNIFRRNTFRTNYDIVYIGFKNPIDIKKLTLLFPIQRRYLLSFSTYLLTNQKLHSLDYTILRFLKNISEEIQRESGSSQIYFDSYCLIDSKFSNISYPLCDNHKIRIKQLKKSLFCLIISPWNDELITTDLEQTRLYECLISGSIPIILGDLKLPFEELIEWSKAVLRMPKQGFIDLISFLENIPESDIFQMKLFGRNYLLSYLFDLSKQIESVSLILTRRLTLNLPISKRYPADILHLNKSISFYSFKLPTFQIEIDPYLGPNNIPPKDSVEFVSNFTRSQNHPISNDKPADLKFYNFPSTPWDPDLPTDLILKGHSSERLFNINHSNNEAGTEFQQSLGGNFLYEQFTIVFLSHKTSKILFKSLELIRGLSYLHSVIIVINEPNRKHLINAKWPDIGVPIKIILAQSNSLNNRFIPYDIIKTDAVLSFDDDMQLRHDEIIFAFRVWRENRDRIVGFPVRYHMEHPNHHHNHLQSNTNSTTSQSYENYKYTNKWFYNSNKTCEYSMVLTGAAFIHRFYFFVYTNHIEPIMDQIRLFVDKVNNCEDIAMNFLVSHITRKPPLKVTVRWTFSCMNCATNNDGAAYSSSDRLHARPDHYTTRTECINLFTHLYGYNPLLYSQYRADSVLFKTRLPQDKQKCFRYI